MIIGIDASRAFVGERTGTEEYAYQVIKHLMRLPESSEHTLVLFVRPKSIIPDWVEEKQVVVRVIRYRYLWTQLGLALATWRQRLDLLWIPAHTLPVLRRPGLPTVVTIHGLEYKWLPQYKNWLQSWYLPLSTYYAANAASRLIAVSDSTRRDLIKETGINSNKVSVIHEGVEVQKLETFQHLEKWDLKGQKYVLFIGSLQPRKNLPILIQAFAKFTRRFPDYRLVIVGGKGWKTRVIFGAPGKWRVQEKVIFTGRVSQEEKTTLIDQASMYVQPSWTEGFGLPLLEAMAQNVPVVTSDGGALSEVAQGAAVIVPIAGYNLHLRLARAMASIATSTQLRVKLSKLGKERVKTHGWETVASSTMSLFTQTIDECKYDN